ncbi:unnamed protein product [Camellia sinensis]
MLGKFTRTLEEKLLVLRIQRDFRMHLARKAYKELCSSAVSIQAGMRGMVARDELRFRRQTKAVIIVQPLSQILSMLALYEVKESCNHHTMCMEGKSCS